MTPAPKVDRYSVQTEETLPPPSLPSADQIYAGRSPMIPARNNGISGLKDGNLTIGGFTLTGTGLQISGKTTQDDWTKVGELLFRLEGAIQWIIGDWLVYGEDVKWGDIPTIAEYLGRDVKTLYNYCAYSRGVKSSLRREDLSYTHHMLVSGMEDEKQAHALAHAAEKKLSVASFRKWIKEGMSEEGSPLEKNIEALPEKTEQRYNVTKLTETGHHVASQDLSKIPPREIQAGIDSLLKANEVNQAAIDRMRQALERWGGR